MRLVSTHLVSSLEADMTALIQVLAYIADALATFCKIHWRPTPTVPITEIFVQECATRPHNEDIMGVEHGYQMGSFLELVTKLPRLRETRMTGAKAPRSPYDRCGFFFVEVRRRH